MPLALNLETELAAARPREMAIRNMVRRLLGVIREESQNLGLEDLFEAAMKEEEDDDDGAHALDLTIYHPVPQTLLTLQ